MGRLIANGLDLSEAQLTWYYQFSVKLEGLVSGFLEQFTKILTEPLKLADPASNMKWQPNPLLISKFWT